MDISIVPPNREEIQRIATTWLTRLLISPTLSGQDLPTYIRGYIYVNGVPCQLSNGVWELNTSGVIYLARSSASSILPLTKLAILTAIANMTGAINDSDIVGRITGRLVAEIRASTIQIHNLIVAAPIKPSRMAVDMDGCRIATEMNGQWFLPGGAPVEVNDTWTVMDF